MKAGDYVRTKRGQIHKITDLKGYYENDKLIEDRQYVYIDNHFSGWDLGQFKELIIKSSPNIIDLIKEHDLLRLYDVEYGEEYIAEVVIDSVDMLSVSNYDCDNFLHLVQELMTNEHIKLISIVTSEQFSQMEYRIGE